MNVKASLPIYEWESELTDIQKNWHKYSLNRLKNEKRLLVALQASGAGMFEYAIPIDEETFITERWANILGYDLKDLPPHTQLVQWVTKKIHPDDLNRVKFSYSNFIRGRLAEFSVEARVRHSSERWIYVRITALPSDYYNTGRPSKIAGVMFDISRSRRIENRLQWELAVSTGVTELSNALINSATSLEDISYIVLDYARLLTNSKKGLVSSIHPATGKNTVHALAGLTPDQLPEMFNGKVDADSPENLRQYPGLWGYVLNTQEAFYTNSPAEHEAVTDKEKNSIHIKNFLAVPALIDGELIGQIAVADSERDFWENDLENIKRLAELYALAVQRKQQEAELQNRNKFIETVFQNLPIGLAVNRISDGKVLDLNPQFEKVYGWPQEILSDVNTFFEKVYPDPGERKALKERIMNDLQSGDPERMRWEGIKVTNQDGTEKIVSAVNIPLPEQNLMISSVQDMTQRWMAEQALRKSEEKYRSFFEDDLTGDFVCNQEGQIVFCNPAFLKMFEFESRKEAYTFNIASLFRKSGLKKSVFKELLKKGKMEHRKMEMQTAKQKTFSVIANLIATIDENKELKQIKGYLFNISSYLNK